MILALVGAIDSTSATPQYAVGGLYAYNHPTYGLQVYRYVYNGEASTAWAAGTVVMNKTAGSATPWYGLVCAVSVAASRVIGVAQAAIAATYYGFILVDGIGLVLADTGGFTVDTGLIPGDTVAGTADNTSGATAASFGIALATTAAAATGLALIRRL